MAKYQSSDIRNIVLCGHSGSGKTMLAEAMLHKTGVLQRLGTTSAGTTVSDFDPEEKERLHSLFTSILHCSYGGKEFNIIDTPGAMGFIGATIGGITGADLAVICVNAQRGVEVMSRRAWDIAGQMGLGRMVVITRMDAEGANYQEALKAVQDTFGKECIPFTIPHGECAEFSGVSRVMDESQTGDDVEALRLQITESAVECDEKLLERYLGGDPISHQEVVDIMQTAIAEGHIVPVFCMAAEKEFGVEEFMTGVAEWGTDPLHAHHHAYRGEEEIQFKPSPESGLCAQVFSVLCDPHIGKLSYFRVFSGTLAAKSSAFISSDGKPEKFAQIYRVQGDKREEITEAITGDIVAVAKIETLHVGDTIHCKEFDAHMKPLPFPAPMAGLAITAKSRNDEQKISANLHRLMEEDPTFRFERNDLTGEQVVRGMGPLHLEVMLSRLKNRYKVEVDTHAPKIPYLETLTQAGDGKYRHKKQSGGAGQFAEVWMRVKPNERGKGFEFVNSIVGGVISGPFIPAVEKGVRAAMEKGPLAGFPVVDVIVELYDGKEHPVDSKDIAFQLAGRHGFEEIAAGCKPALLEPLVNMEIVFPADCTGDISADLATRRGRPTGMEQLGAMQVLHALVPLAEVASYGSVLRAITQGEGTYSMTLSHYEPVPGNVSQKLIQQLKAEAASHE